MMLEWKLKKIRLKEQKRLNDNNFALYKNMVDYIKVSDLTGLQKEEIFQDIMDIMLQAQMEDKNIDLFIGKDYEVFCNNIIEEYSNGISKKYKIVNYIQRYIFVFMSLFIIMGISNKFNGDSISIGVTINQIIFINFIALFLTPILRIRKQGDINIYPIYFPIQKIIKVRRIRNNKSIMVPYCAMFIVSIILNNIIQTVMDIDTTRYIVKIKPLYGAGVISIIMIMELYKIMYNKVWREQ
ncbi:hypothetical protein Z968_08915 [Clostridium novyi A str. 4552]|uniref:DUF1129 domain-containing protein n=2 Tax=Clostridium novyi TaxID=1542 RepID=A0A0A0I759_CLONO|nr:hypothetical protein Z968_08915 [Clostridium novyi A str. 4552]